MVKPLQNLDIDPICTTLDDLSYTMGLLDKFEASLFHDHDELQLLTSRIHSHLILVDLLGSGPGKAKHVSNISLAFCLRIVCARASRLMPKIRREHVATKSVAA